MRWVRNEQGVVQTETVEITYADRITRKVRRPLLEIFEPKSEKEVEKGTVARRSGTCPVTGYTTPIESVKRQLKERKGGAMDARLFCVVVVNAITQNKLYRLPSQKDLIAIQKTVEALNKLESLSLNVIPNELLPPQGTLGFRVQLYGMQYWRELFTSRQLLTLAVLERTIKKLSNRAVEEFSDEKDLANAIQIILSLTIDKLADFETLLLDGAMMIKELLLYLVVKYCLWSGTLLNQT